MGKRLFVGNLPFSATIDEIRELFSQHGQVEDVHIVMDRDTGRPRGFAFVTMSTDERAVAATNALNDHRFGGRPLVVNEARDRGAPPPAGGGGPRPGGPPRPAGPRPDRPPRPAGGPPPSRGPAFEPPPEEGMEEPRRRPRTASRKPPTHERPDGARQRPEEEDDYASVSNWREFLDEDEEAGDVSLLPGEDVDDEETAEEEEEDWRKYVDSDEDEGGGSLGDKFKG